MEFFLGLSVWIVAVAVFGLRIVDVTLGTLRTIMVVQGRVMLAVFIGFFEVLIWVAVVSEVIVRVQDNPVLLVAYAAGFGMGNACGIMVERWIGLGTCVIRMITGGDGVAVAKAIRMNGYEATAFPGTGSTGPRTLVFTTCPRRAVDDVVEDVAGVDPEIFYTVERFSQTAQVGPLPHPTGWRGVLKKK